MPPLLRLSDYFVSVSSRLKTVLPRILPSTDLELVEFRSTLGNTQSLCEWLLLSAS